MRGKWLLKIGGIEARQRCVFARDLSISNDPRKGDLLLGFGGKDWGP